ncbi:TPA: UvrD-helicase domain-containing protein [Pseudomonas aeruginosa]
MGSVSESNVKTSANRAITQPAQAQGFWSRAAHILAEWMLRAVQAHDSSSWEAGRSAGFADGYEKGRKKGLQKGYEEGHEAGLEAGKLILELKSGATPIDVAPGVDANLFENFAFPISAELENAIRLDIQARLPDYQHPTPQQWDMILSRSPSTYIVAGAGSGKSTTMVLRLLVLHHYLKVPLSSITVVTFTRDSRFDFIAKVIKVFGLWDIPLDEDAGKSFVRTFHSRILDFFKWSPAFQGAKAFEFLSKDPGAEDEEPENVLDIRLNSRQLELMNRCYQHLFENHERFRALVIELVSHSVRIGEPLNPDDPTQAKRIRMLKRCSDRDQETCEAVESLWQKAGYWPMPGVRAEIVPLTFRAQTFHANGYVEELEALVVLGLDRNEGDSFTVESGKTKLSLALNMRKIFFQLFYSERVLFFSNYEEALSSLETLKGKVSASPKFSYQVNGELKPAPIMQAFHSTASFLENVGLGVPEAIKGMAFKEEDIEAKFFEALGLFWPAFERFLAEQNPPIFTFNKMFAIYSERGEENFRKLPDSVLKPQMVTLVDEFQDCGANTITWLRGVFAELRRRGTRQDSPRGVIYPSLMAVGDDWQSIYGWRGSSPKFFQQFTSYFPSPNTLPLMLQQNFRSQQMVIDAAESIVKLTRSIEGKHGEASHADVKQLKFPVQLWTRDDDRLVTLLEEHYESGHEIMVLSRSRNTLDELTQKLGGVLLRAKRDKQPHRVRLMTYHGSKGLEADVVFLVGDCEQKTLSDYRNQAYAQANLGIDGEPRAYDAAQAEEVMRLAYVAITRAKLHCYWFMDPVKAASQGLLKASERIDKSQLYFQDFRRG